MKIIEVETKNHKVIGDIHLNTNSEIISFLGRNGSGKSFLLFILHPFGSSDRYSSSYPILPNVTGYKRIVFQDRYGIIYETIHEYTPKPKSDKHSCKSYLNIIENGVKRELNQNGHVPLYEELVDKYLHFTSAVSDICYITSKLDGLTSATPKRRKEIIESTNYSNILKIMQNNAQEQLRDHKSMLKVLSDRRLELVGNESKKEIEENIFNIKQSIKLANDKLEIYNKNFMALQVELKEKEKLSISKKELTTITSLVNILSETGMETYSKLIDTLNKGRQQNAIDAEKIKSVETLLNEYNDKLNIIKNKEFIELKMTEIKTALESTERKLTPLFNTKDINDIIDKVKAFKSIIVYYDNVKNNLDIELGGQSISSYIKSIRDNLQNAITFVNKYELILEESDESFLNTSIDIQNNCNTCPLYNKFVKHAKYIEDNRSKYEASKEDINTYNNILNDIEALYTESNKSILLDLYNILSENGRNKCGIGKSFEEIYNINKQYYEISEYILGTAMHQKELSESLKLKEVEYSTYESSYNKQEIEAEILNNKKLKEEYQNRIQNTYSTIIIQLERYENLDIPDEYKIKTLDNLKDLINVFTNKVQIIEDLTNRINTLSSDKIHLELEITNNSKNLVIMEHRLESLNHTVESILKYSSDTEIYKRTKEILTKDIPILMLQNNLEFMKNTTNKIFEDNNIDIVIDMTSNGTEISIPVYINGDLVPDIRHVSQGENCLISLLLNACMCHLIGYHIVYLDEIDANLDIINKEKFNNIVYSILNHLNIDQIFCISHNIASNIDSAKKFVLGNTDNGFLIPKDAIKVKN